VLKGWQGKALALFYTKILGLLLENMKTLKEKVFKG
jgi:hypothetical protein